MKADAHALAWLRIKHRTLGLEIFALRVNLEHGLRSLFERIGNFHIAAKKTQLGYPPRRAPGRALFRDFGCRSEWKPWSLAPFIFHEVTPESSCGILSLVGQIGTLNNGQNEAKVGEKVMSWPGGVAAYATSGVTKGLTYY